MHFKPAAAALSLLVPSAVALADTLWNELSQGDLSDDRLAPTALQLVDGDNVLFGALEGSRPLGGIDRDYFSLTVPAGLRLASMILDLYDSPDQTAFVAIQPGSIFPNEPDNVGPNDLMGWAHFGPTDVAQDLFPKMSSNGYGFIAPLPAGTYTLWAQQLDDYTSWNAIFVVTPVPAPAPLAALACWACAIAGRTRRAR